MKDETIKAVRHWLSQSPESCHQYDMERFYNIFKVAKGNGDLHELSFLDLEPYVREAKSKACDEFISKFCLEWHAKIQMCVNLLNHVC